MPLEACLCFTKQKCLKKYREEVQLKKFYITLFLITMGLIFSSPLTYAEMAKEGSGPYRSGKSGTFDFIALGKDRFQLNYDETGAIVEAPDNSPLRNATYRTIGTQYGFGGKITWKLP